VTTFLLDTHVWLWLQTAPERVGETLRNRFEDGSNELLLSAASSWEISIKYGLGKLRLPLPPEAYVPDRMRRSGTGSLAVEHLHALRVAELPMLHRDPFDRLLVVQAQLLDLVLVTADPQIAKYDVSVEFVES
jgi:PIN domain nuclease of toxin-antitoxin system